jgi:hypothetical protein
METQGNDKYKDIHLPKDLFPEIVGDILLRLGPEVNEVPLRPVNVSPKKLKTINQRGEWRKLGDTIAFFYDGMFTAEILDKNRAYGGRHTLRYEVEDEHTGASEGFQGLREAKKMALLAVAVPYLQRDGFLDRSGAPIAD